MSSTNKRPPYRDLLDLTHEFVEGMPVYPGDPHPQLLQIAHIDRDGFNEHSLKLGLHVGTHMDAPLHMVNQGAPLSAVPLSQFFGRGVFVNIPGAHTISEKELRKHRISQGDIVVVNTGWGKKFTEPDYFDGFPQVTEKAAHHLATAGAAILALDTPSPDLAPFPVHKILLGAGVLIIENIANPEQLAAVSDFDICAVPPKLRLDAAPVRVVAIPRHSGSN